MICVYKKERTIYYMIHKFTRASVDNEEIVSFVFTVMLLIVAGMLAMGRAMVWVMAGELAFWSGPKMANVAFDVGYEDEPWRDRMGISQLLISLTGAIWFVFECAVLCNAVPRRTVVATRSVLIALEVVGLSLNTYCCLRKDLRRK
jgi:hypothetical protein